MKLIAATAIIALAFPRIVAAADRPRVARFNATEPFPRANRRSLRAGDFIVGGWVGDDPWEETVPFQGLDFLDYGYLSCIKTGVNGPCGSPGQRSVDTKPDASKFNGAACVRFVIGGDKCNAADWNPEFYANKDWGCGVDVDNECEMTAEQISQQFNAVKNAGKSTMYTFLHHKTDLLKALTVKPDHYAVMSFYGANWCRQPDVPAGCQKGPGDKSYEESVPQIIDNILSQIGAGNSKQLLLGLHANGIDKKTVDDWCRFIREKNLGGVMITFIHRMDKALFDGLKDCLAAPAPAPAPTPKCIAGDTRFHVTDLVGTTFEKQLDQIAMGEKIVGINENKVKVENCEVVSVFEMGVYEVFGNYTPEHYMLPSNAADKLVAHGQTGGARNFTTHQLLTTCPVAVDESGKISSTSICGTDLTKGFGPIPWKTYLDIHSTFLTLIQATGITSMKALKSRPSAEKHLQGLCTYGLLCSMTGMCDIYEEMMLNFVNAELTDDAKAKAYAAFPDLGDASSPKSCSYAVYNKKQQKQQSSKTTKETTKAGKVFGSGSRSEKSGFSAEVTGGADVKVELAGDMVVESEAVAWGAATEETWGGDADDTWASTAAKAFKANSKAKK